MNLIGAKLDKQQAQERAQNIRDMIPASEEPDLSDLESTSEYNDIDEQEYMNENISSKEKQKEKQKQIKHKKDKTKEQINTQFYYHKKQFGTGPNGFDSEQRRTVRMQAEDFPVWVGLLKQPDPMMFDLEKHTDDASKRNKQQIDAVGTEMYPMFAPHAEINVVAYDGMGQRIAKIENTFNTEYERVFQPEIDEEEGSDIKHKLLFIDQQNEQQITSNNNTKIKGHNASFWRITPQATLWNVWNDGISIRVDSTQNEIQPINQQIRDEVIRCMKSGIVCRALHWGRNIFGKSSYVQNLRYVEVQLLGERNNQQENDNLNNNNQQDENKQIIPLSEIKLREQEKIRKQKLANVASWSSGKLAQNSIHYSPAFAGEYESMKERFMENLKIFLEHIFQVILKYNSKQQSNLEGVGNQQNIPPNIDSLSNASSMSSFYSNSSEKEIEKNQIINDNELKLDGQIGQLYNQEDPNNENQNGESNQQIDQIENSTVQAAMLYQRPNIFENADIEHLQSLVIQRISRDNTNWISTQEHQQNIWNDLQQPLWVNHCRRKAMERIEEVIYQITMHYYPQSQVLLVLIIALAEHQNARS
ncbi:MAG: hypothetical protein EZS28_018813 [Streblomastix strix]|uniref:Uncharacterized protein n=1 Tax=Streblomastix strix TaxID=222440 RepID=A0A5J4VT77_9EUKA|nr:MAG: hypothetical protein EZS28_018813 [Streblomastix strix]